MHSPGVLPGTTFNYVLPATGMCLDENAQAQTRMLGEWSSQKYFKLSIELD